MEDDGMYNMPQVLVGVCRTWSNLALKTRSLWTRLLIENENGPLSPLNRLKLHRSQGAQLSIDFRKASPEAVEELAEHMGAWKTFWIGFESYTPVLEAIEELFQANQEGFCLPNLEELTMDFTRPEDLACWIEEPGILGEGDDRLWPNRSQLLLSTSPATVWTKWNSSFSPSNVLAWSR